jgi:RHS repeat-associated protein
LTLCSHALGAQNPQDNGTWGGSRVGMAGNVAPGQTATFTFQVTAPWTPGNYNFQWQMVQDGVEWFGAPSTNVVINVVAPRQNNAQFIGQSVPSAMTAGVQYSTSVTFTNTGNTTWDPANGKYSIAAINPVNNPSWGYNRAGLGSPVAPGEQRTFPITVTAPATPGNYNFQWMLIEEGVELFGTPSSNVAVSVTAAPANGAAALGMSVPSLTQGQNATISVTMQNTGNTTWPAGSNYKLGSKNPDENLIWGVQRVDLASNVAPGQQTTFTFPITAPATGTYTMQWQMMQRYVEWFGGIASASVTVGAQSDTITYIHTDALGSPVARSDSAGTIISRTSYEPYGRTASGVTPTIGFTGHVNDANTGLVYMQQRYYDPVAGRFLSVDPVTTDASTGGAFNRYAYAANSPYRYIDLDGRSPDPFAEAQPKRQVGVRLFDVRLLVEAAKRISEWANNAPKRTDAADTPKSEDKGTSTDVKIDDKIAGQLGERGWTEQGVRDLTKTDPTGVSTDKRSPGKTDDGKGRNDSATVYGPKEGGHVVVNDTTKEVIQISNKNDPNWVPDSRIDWK